MPCGCWFHLFTALKSPKTTRLTVKILPETFLSDKQVDIYWVLCAKSVRSIAERAAHIITLSYPCRTISM